MIDSCTRARELLPERAAGRAGTGEDGIEAHLEGCPTCSQELRLLTLLAEHRPVAPRGLGDRILREVDDSGADPGVKTSPRTRGGAAVMGFPWWGLMAAAVTGVALGIGLDPQAGGVPGGTDADGTAPAILSEEVGDWIWVGGDGEVAGAPVLEQLSDEELEALLNDLENGGVA